MALKDNVCLHMECNFPVEETVKHIDEVCNQVIGFNDLLSCNDDLNCIETVLKIKNICTRYLNEQKRS